MLLAFVTRALHDTVFNAWYDHETEDVAGLIDDLIARLRAFFLSSAERPARRPQARIATARRIRL
jgi:hypothetical protein